MATKARRLRDAADSRAAKDAADYFVLVCQTGNVAKLLRVPSLLDETIGGWTAAMRAVARRVQSVSPNIQQAFLEIWIEHKVQPRTVGDNRALCDAARVLLPSYNGPAVRLYRGAGACERRHHSYGLAWAADVAVAERFARVHQDGDGGSVVLETLAPAEAIICAVDYPEPNTVEELKHHFHPAISPSAIQTILDNSNEREFIVDSRRLGAVNVVRRYAQLPITKLDWDPTDSDAA